MNLIRPWMKRACLGALIGGLALPLAAALAVTCFLAIVGTREAGLVRTAGTLPALFASSLYYGLVVVLPPGLVTGFVLGLGWRSAPGS